MTPQDPRIEKLFNGARQLASREERRAYLDTACGKDALRERLERLLESSQGADAFFEERPAGLTSVAETTPIALRQEADLSEGPGKMEEVRAGSSLASMDSPWPTFGYCRNLEGSTRG